MSQYLDPFLLLQEYEMHARQFAASLPREEKEQFLWTGIGFQCEGHKCIAHLDSIAEVVGLPSITHLPWVAPWLRGMIHVRGELMSVMDLSLFLGGAPTSIKSDTRLMVVQQDGLKVGLLIDAILGSIRVYKNTVLDNAPEVPANFTPYVASSIKFDHETWWVFDFKNLFDSPEFYKISA